MPNDLKIPHEELEYEIRNRLLPILKSIDHFYLEFSPRTCLDIKVNKDEDFIRIVNIDRVNSNGTVTHSVHYLPMAYLNLEDDVLSIIIKQELEIKNHKHKNPNVFENEVTLPPASFTHVNIIENNLNDVMNPKISLGDRYAKSYRELLKEQNEKRIKENTF